MKTKTCAKCKQRFNVTDFYKHKAYKDGLNSICKSCVLSYDKERMKKCEPKKTGNKICSTCKKELDVSFFTKRLRSLDGLRNRCKICDNTAKKIYSKKNPKQRFIAKIRQLYGLSEGQYKEMLVNQDYKCNICKKVKKLVIDHCHKTSKVRSLLCHNCNAGIGMFFENSEILSNAIDYIRLFNES